MDELRIRSERFSVSVTPGLLARIDDYAAEHRWTRSTAAAELIEQALDAKEGSKSGEAPVLARDEDALYAFDNEAEVVCPDCDEVSPPLGSVFAAAKWAERHSNECPV